MESKICSNCKIEKPNNEFSVRTGRKSGLQSRCKQCYSELRGSKTRRIPPKITLTEAQAAYLAGLVDGEGHIGIYMRRHNKTQNLNLVMFMTITSTSDELFDMQKEAGIGTIAKRKRRQPQHKPCNVWTMHANACRSLIPLLSPYMRIRKKQALLAMQYLDLAYKKKVRDPMYRSQVVKVYNELRKLNLRSTNTLEFAS